MVSDICQSVIARHIRNIYKEEELDEEGTYAKFAYMGHDGFLIIDDVVYLFGASLKDAGKKLFAYIRMQETPAAELHKLLVEGVRSDAHSFVLSSRPPPLSSRAQSRDLLPPTKSNPLPPLCRNLLHLSQQLR